MNKTTKPALVIMAAGMGSRYGGLKQMDPVGPNGEPIIDYSIYDALKAGFDHVVFIIKKEIEKEFRDVIGKKVEEKTHVTYVFQDINDLPEGFTAPSNREKPWGTGQAVLCCKDHIKTPFAVINADDLYGRGSYQVLYEFLENIKDPSVKDYSLVGYVLKNTLTDHGTVARGVCKANTEGYLEEINERLRIKRFPDSVKYENEDGSWTDLSENSIVSLNFWGFAPSIFEELETGFVDFLKADETDIEKAEFLLPNFAGDLLKANRATFKVLPTQERWYGVTYREDMPRVRLAVEKMIEEGLYPKNL